MCPEGKYRPDHHRVFDTGDDFDISTAFAASFNIDIKHAFQASPHGAYFWCAQVIAAWRSAGVWFGLSFATLIFLPLPRLAGVTLARYLLFGAKTP